jgi:D-alanyl-D-alanine carboxypeptidase
VPLSKLAATLVRDGAPGALVAVRTPTAFRRAARGLGQRQPRVPLRTTDTFRVASITKPFVATVVLQLVAEGGLRLDDSVERWLPGLVPGGGSITVRELLDHTSGLFDFGDDAGWQSKVLADPATEWPPRELVGIATAHPRAFLPGAGWAYSNTNYVLLGLVVEAVAGTTLERQLTDRLFRPLALDATSLPTGTSMPGHPAHGYIGFATLPWLQGLLDTTTLISNSVAWAAGGIVSDADDLTRFFAALLGGRLLRPDLLAEMKTPVSGSGYGLGLWRFRTRCGVAYGHIGIGNGYRAVVYARPGGGRVAVAMVNVDHTYVALAELEAATATALCRG